MAIDEWTRHNEKTTVDKRERERELRKIERKNKVKQVNSREGRREEENLEKRCKPCR